MAPVSFRVGNARLLKLAALLRTVPAERFDYTSWVSEDLKGRQLKTACGTTACAAGWATTIPSFRRAGLQLRGGFLNPHMPFHKDEKTGYENYGFGAMEVFFGIPYDDALKLFSANTDDEMKATAKQVAQKIERYVNKRIKTKKGEKS